MAEAKGAVCEDLDMISALPEELLLKILLRVPIKDAVATMILSKRWRFIWMMLPRLDYKEKRYGDDFMNDYDEDDDDDDDNDDDESNKSIWWFFEKSMELHKAHVLTTLLIKLGPGCPSDADVQKWLKKAVDRHVRVLRFKLCWSTVPTGLPKSLYTCQTLKELTLSRKILVDFPSSSCLPSLIILELFYVVYKEDDSLVRLLSGCPVLEYLMVKRNKDDNVTKFSVKVPSLLDLLYSNYNTPDDNDIVDTGRCLVIDTPALINYHIADMSGDSCSIENMPCLESAYIDVESFADIDRVLTSISAVVSLELAMTDVLLVGCSNINFSRLIKLSIYPDMSHWLEPLLILLKNAPKLKDLLVDYVYICTEDLTLSWDQPSSIPRCLSSQLEIFEYRQYRDTEEDEEFLTYILANSKCLKTVTVSVKPSFDLERKELIIKKLRDIPRVSTTSQLLFK
ncbi:hypothetical protein EUTSA_v10027331mg [Eutrema salsugineum]|uniref:F-box domain-containing protein n=2 Tax=Eutrema salsugineum TaxID=72664 RepID=V4MM77_EUTSA|nr:hypothetical protein EUTSA_v10027331mg [Eutrema salsugineum]